MGLFTMGEGTGGRAPPIGGLVRFFTFPFFYMQHENECTFDNDTVLK